MNPDAPNPFEAPTAPGPASQPLEPTDPSLPRPRSPMVFGVIALIVGGLTLLTGVFGLAAVAVMQGAGAGQPGMPTGAFGTAYMWIINILNIVASGVLLAAGVSLVRYRKPGAPLFNTYAWMSIGLTVVGVVFLFFNYNNTIEQMAAANPELASPEMQAMMRASMIVGAAIPLMWLAYPILGLLLLNRDRVKQSLT